MQPLPIDAHLEEVRAGVRRQGVLVLVAPPGAGKTTRVPAAILPLLAPGRQLVTVQPRRIAAIGAAARVAEERGGTLGEEVGYAVRFEHRTSPRTRLQFVTEGVLLRMLQDDPFLERLGGVILDEFHERRLATDLLIALLRDVRRSARPDLLLVVMSATLEAREVAGFLDGAPVLKTRGRAHPVAVRHCGRFERPAAPQVHAALAGAWGETHGHALVFLPGLREMRATAAELRAFADRHGAGIEMLHGRMPLAAQRRILAGGTQRRVILATNVAETSITVDGVDLVIDSGLARELRQDLRTGLERLETVRISRPSAVQRAGRAGRQGPGLALRLYSEREEAALEAATRAEIRSADLAGAVLQLRAFGVGDPAGFGWFEAPPAEALARADQLLRELGALQQGGALSATGRELAAIPAHPRLARVLLAARQDGCTAEAALLCALLEEREGLRAERPAPDQDAECDLVLRAERLAALDPGARRAVQRLERELCRSAGTPRARVQGRWRAARRALLAGFPDRVCRRRAHDPMRGVMVGGRGVQLGPHSAVRRGELFLALDVADMVPGKPRDALVYQACAVEAAWLRELFPGAIETRVQHAFDAQAGRAIAQRGEYFHDLALGELQRAAPDARQAEILLLEEVRRRAPELFAADAGAAQWLQRVGWLAATLPELALPGFTAERQQRALATACAGRSSLAEVRALDLCALLAAELTHEQRRQLERLAPAELAIPGGRKVRLQYDVAGPPQLRVRLQELFGCPATPSVAGGRVPVLLELLGPNFRPVQRTQDLASFWKNTYPQVRKDLRGRYPKHSWPEDPLTAPPARGTHRPPRPR